MFFEIENKEHCNIKTKSRIAYPGTLGAHPGTHGPHPSTHGAHPGTHGAVQKNLITPMIILALILSRNMVFIWHDRRNDRQRCRQKRKNRKVAKCQMPGCPKFAQYGWAHGFCKNHALLRGCRPAKKSKAQSQVERAVAGGQCHESGEVEKSQVEKSQVEKSKVEKSQVEKSQAQSQVDSATKAKWELEEKIIQGRITSSGEGWFDEVTELEGREDYEADYEKVLDALEYLGDYSNRDPAVLSCLGLDLLDELELSDVPVAPPANLPPKFWQQMYRRRLRKKTNVTLPKIDIWGLVTLPKIDI